MILSVEHWKPQFRVVLLAMVCVAVFWSPSSRKSSKAARKVLVVGTDYAPPYYFQESDGTITGVAVEVLNRAAAELDFDLKFVHVSGYPDQYLQSHQVDLWPLLTITEKRSREYHMTAPWLYNTFCLLSRGKEKPGTNGRKLLAHWSDPLHTEHAKRFFPEAKLFSLPNRESVIRAVCTGQADSGLLEVRVLDSLLLNRPPGCETAKLARTLIPGAAFPLGIAAVKSASREAEQLHLRIANMAASGDLATIFEKWASVSANEANSILAMNAARQRSHQVYAGGLLLIIVSIAVFLNARRVRRAFRIAQHETTERKRAEDAHREADRIRNMVLEGAGEGICGLDAQGMTTFLNSAACKLLNISVDAAAGRMFHSLVHRPAAGKCGQDCLLHRSINHEVVVGNNFEEFYRADNSPFPAEYTLSPLFQDGQKIGSVLTFSDITARRKAEFLDRDRNLVLEMLAENRSLDSILETIIRLIERQYPELSCSVMVANGNSLELRSAPSLSPAFCRIVERSDISDMSRSCGTAAFRCKPVIVADIATDPVWASWSELALAEGFYCCWSYPIQSASGDVLGTIAAYGKRPGIPEADQEQLLQVACRLARLAIEQTRLHQRLHHQAHHDSLTGLPNRLSFEERLRHALEEAKRNQSICALLYIDLDRFKQINDTLSHHVGDMYLCQVADRLRKLIPTSAMLARLGGDEFAIVAPEIRDGRDAETLAADLLEGMTSPFSLDGFTLFGTASVGIGLSSLAGSAAELQSCADQAMYSAKKLGRNRYHVYSSDMSRRMIEQVEIEKLVREALDRNLFQLYYQPQCCARGELIGFEALIRLIHPEKGIVPPNEFIGVAEESGLIVPIGLWVLREACRQLSVWRNMGFPDLTVAINVSSAQISQSDFADEVAAALADSQLPPAALDIELTESMIMKDFDESLEQMARLRSLGVRLSIDDFGTGYSSLSHLHRLPVQTIKIDQSFVRAMTSEVSSKPLVEAIIAAARSLNCNVIAEGVETEDQRRELARMGCDHMQGYLFSRPLPASEALKQFEVLPLAS